MMFPQMFSPHLRGLVAGLGVGAGLMFMFDPVRGRRRRALLGDKLDHLAHVFRRGTDKASRDIESRMRGLGHRVRTRLEPGHESPPRRPRRHHVRWAPSTRVGAGALGAALVFRGLIRRDLTGLGCLAGGAALLARAAGNLPIRQLLGLGQRAEIHLQHMLIVRAPIERVFALWRRFENFPRFMDHVRSVEVSEDGQRSRWTVSGPAGTTVEWEAVITRLENNRIIAWQTVPNSRVEHTGTIRFVEVPEGTRLDIRMTYGPPAGALGHAVARLFHTDPDAAMTDDLLRMKSLLEDGKASAHGEQVVVDELL